MKVLVLTLGFDERFAIRAMLRAGIESGDRIIIFIVKPVEEKALACLKIVREFLSKYVEDVDFRVSEIAINRFEDAVLKIKKQLQDITKGANKVILNLSGGMKLLTFETLIASLLLGLNCIVEIELENFTDVVSFPIKLLKVIKLSGVDLKILVNLLEVKDWVGLSEISKKSDVPKSTAHKRLRRLVNASLVEARRVGRKMFYRACKSAYMYV